MEEFEVKSKFHNINIFIKNKHANINKCQDKKNFKMKDKILAKQRNDNKFTRPFHKGDIIIENHIENEDITAKCVCKLNSSPYLSL